MDCDNQFDPEELAKLVPLTDYAQIIIGLRTRRADEWRRIWAGRAWNQLCQLAFDFIVHDIDCGFKLLDRAAISSLALGSDGACISVELRVAAREAEFGLAEGLADVPLRIAGRVTG